MNNYSDLKFSWQGEILAERGYGTTARRILKPLIEGGANVKLISDEGYIPETSRIKDPFWLNQLELSKSKPDMPVHICYCIPPLFKPVKGAINILSSQWESSCFPKEWVPTINQANVFWVGTPSLVQSAKNAGVSIPIDVMDATIDPNEWIPEGSSTSIVEIPDNTVKFMFVGDWIPRKNYEDLIIGYLTAFNGCKDTALIIKTWSNQPGGDGRKNIENGIKHLGEKLQGIDRPRIYLITDMIEEQKLISLMRSADCYVSVSRGEGFDLPMVQAMSLGKLVLGTNYLAHSDYMTVDNSIPVKFTMKPVYDAHAPLYHGYQWWSSPDMFDYVSKLRIAYNLIKTGRDKEIGAQARNTIIERYSPESNTPRIVKAIANAMALSKKSALTAVASL